MLEIEAKIKIKNRNELFSKGNLIQKAKNNVFDIYYDINRKLKSEDKALRLRKQNDMATMTLKGPRIPDKNLHVREEYEIKISDFELSKKMLALLGYAPTQVVEKTRETFMMAGYDVKIELDHYPFIGYYLEIEGERSSVLAVMKKLHYSMDHGIIKNCTEIFYEYLNQNNIKLAKPHLQFTFLDDKKSTL